MVKTAVFAVLWGALLLVSGAPRGKTKTSQTIYDQKQSGDFNIQLHLKDFQIIALADDSLGSLGDYEYSYDYSDYTVKPSNATQKPMSGQKPLPTEKPSSTHKPTTEGPWISQEPTLMMTTVLNNVSTSLNAATENVNIVDESSQKPSLISNKTEQSLMINEKGPVQIIESSHPPPSSVILPSSEEPHDKIKVQIIETPVLPLDDGPRPSIMDLGELMHYRKCGVGYARDQKGRCRRVRRPSLSLERLASTLAARLRTASLSSANLNQD